MTLEDPDKKRKRLIFRSWHRGTREMDLILGTFADRPVPGFAADELDQYEALLKYSDPDIYNWITGRETVPANLPGPVHPIQKPYITICTNCMYRQAFYQFFKGGNYLRLEVIEWRFEELPGWSSRIFYFLLPITMR